MKKGSEMLHLRRFKMDSLVREKMPSRIKKLGGRVQLRRLDSETYPQYLKLKLKEEVEEVCNAETPKDIKEEIADVLEVIYTLAKSYGLQLDHIEQTRLQKRKERGGFNKGIFAEYVEVDTEEDDDEHPIVQYCLEDPKKYPEIL
jgi:predicted house-cleaning noncanonical NTP pyrophosphatase (MazG superfamily)